jgi:glycosyltransferase involved in cell wall biosynthesis
VRAAQTLRAEKLNVGEPDPGNPASVPEEQLTTWREEGNVTFLGHVQDMPALMTTAYVVVLPSYREGVPTRSRQLLLPIATLAAAC